MTPPDTFPACPLCGSSELGGACEAHERHYHECRECHLISLAAEHRPGPSAERAHYTTHENDPGDAGYRRFLSRLAEPLVERLPSGAEGLDYGSGPGPTLSVMLRERGFFQNLYDPYFSPDRSVLERTYDFITCTETAEHFFEPGAEFARLDGMLRPGGWLGVMTEMIPEDRPIREWRYLRDPTHVCFYRPETMRWIAARYHWNSVFPHRNVVLFRKAVVR